MTLEALCRLCKVLQHEVLTVWTQGRKAGHILYLCSAYYQSATHLRHERLKPESLGRTRRRVERNAQSKSKKPRVFGRATPQK